MKGGGSWTSLCPICGIHFRISFDKSTIEELSNYSSKKRKSEDQLIKLNKIISNFKKFKIIEKNNKMFSKYNKITMLLPNGIIKHNIKYDDNCDFDKYTEVFFNDSRMETAGLPMHTECWKLAESKFNHKLKYEDFLFNKNETKLTKEEKRKLDLSIYLLHYIDYKIASKYSTQDWIDNIFDIRFENFLFNEKDWYILYLPSGESDEAQRNSKRIEKNLLKIIKGITKNITKNITLKVRPSPSESATLFKQGTKKKGNDGIMYIIDVNKNGVNRWKKVV